MKNHPVDVLIVGGGIIGVATAYWAAKSGISVVLCERHGKCGLETSFANGGQLSVSHAEPWANPAAPLKVLRWLLDDRAPLLFRPKLDWKQWWWIADFLRQCSPKLCSRNTQKIIELASYSQVLINEVSQNECIDYAQLRTGILHYYRTTSEFRNAKKMAALMRELGCERQAIDREKILEIEPAFHHSISSIVGATYTPTDQSGDARVFTQSLAIAAQKYGAKFLYDTDVIDLFVEADGRIGGCDALIGGQHERITATNTVIAMGSHSAAFAARYGDRINIYPTKGYSASIPIENGHGAPRTSLTDDENKLVFSNLGTHLRVAGTAELSGFSRHLDPVRCQAIIDKVREIFPEAGDFDRATFWSGLRPTTPSNVPHIRAASRPGLWLNAGHGTLGWTMGMGSGRLLVDLIARKKPEIDWQCPY